jgi:hypothetical protein
MQDQCLRHKKNQQIRTRTESIQEDVHPVVEDPVPVAMAAWSRAWSYAKHAAV